MFREHWRELAFWKWWWNNRVPPELRAGAIVALLGLVLGGGLFVAALTTRHDPGARAAAQIETTEVKVVTIRERGHVVSKLVPVVKRVTLRPSTAYETQTALQTRYVTSPGHVQVVDKPVVRYVPVVKKRVVTVGGKTHTVGVTVRVPTTRFVTQTNQVTNLQTVTNATTVHDRVTQTQTVHDTHTVTNTQTVTNTVTNTQTETQVQTVTLPPVTITQIVTVTVPLP